MISAPFPWFGGKSRVAEHIWPRLGDVENYVEPFAGSLAVLLARPKSRRRQTETVNDLDGFVANFWRAISHDPEAVAAWSDWPVNENDLHARHAYLVNARADLTARLEGDPEFYDVRIAGWWVWGICSYIGSGWCSGEGPWGVVDGRLVNRKLPHLGDAGRGINRQLPHLGNAGRGINRKLPHLGNAGRGINRKLPHLGNAGQGILDWFTLLADRLRTVRVTCGDWTRVVTDSVTVRHGTTAVFLDPPYGDEIEQTRVYSTDSGTVSDDVREWCLTNGDNPALRIALCGYAGEGHEALEGAGWASHAWRTAGGYGGGRGGAGDTNRHRERVWFSPACIEAAQPDLFGGAA
jgi:hypothetical protein